MTKEIPLSQGKFALVDDDDFPKINIHKWSYGHGYAVRMTSTLFGKSRLIYMHREITNAPKGKEVDHINLDRLDNCRGNLRICERAENQANSKSYKNNSSGYKGVRYFKKRRKWTAQIMVNYKSIYLGIFVNSEEAARAYDAAAKVYFGEFAKLNFPEG